MIENSYARAWPEFVGLLGGEMPGSARRFGEALLGDMRRVARALEGPPRTLAHGDFRLANVMFGGPEGAPPFAEIDWEDVSVGRGVVDVAWFIVGCLSVSDRRAHERGLLQSYHRALVDRGVLGYPFEYLRDDYRAAMLDRFVQAVLMATSPSVVARRRRFGQALAERFVAASGDHRMTELLRR